MPSFAYTVIVTENNSITEANGVVNAASLAYAQQMLVAQGYAVRNLRPATPEEIRLEGLRQFKRKLEGKTESVRPPVERMIPVPITSSRSLLVYVIVVAAVAFIAICLYLFGGKS